MLHRSIVHSHVQHPDKASASYCFHKYKPLNLVPAHPNSESHRWMWQTAKQPSRPPALTNSVPLLDSTQPTSCPPMKATLPRRAGPWQSSMMHLVRGLLHSRKFAARHDWRWMPILAGAECLLSKSSPYHGCILQNFLRCLDIADYCFKAHCNCSQLRIYREGNHIGGLDVYVRVLQWKRCIASILWVVISLIQSVPFLLKTPKVTHISDFSLSAKKCSEWGLPDLHLTDTELSRGCHI